MAIVTNTGSVELSNIVVTDDRIARLTFVGGDTDNDGRLDVSETWTYTAMETVQSGTEYVNVGTVVGRDVVMRVAKGEAHPADVALDVQGVTVGGPHSKPAVQNVSFQVRAGEIVGIAGVEGNGQRELVELAAGLLKSIEGSP